MGRAGSGDGSGSSSQPLPISSHGILETLSGAGERVHRWLLATCGLSRASTVRGSSPLGASGWGAAMGGGFGLCPPVMGLPGKAGQPLHKTGGCLRGPGVQFCMAALSATKPPGRPWASHLLSVHLTYHTGLLERVDQRRGGAW